MNPSPARVAIIGAGISGLAAAHRFTELAPDLPITVFEAAPRVGGIIDSAAHNGFLIERSADSFITQIPAALRLCERLGIAGDLIPTNETDRRAMVVRNGKLLPIPEGFVIMSPRQWRPILASPILSWRGKLRLACEPLIPARREVADESVAAFANRRLGQECFQRLVQPLLSGIYTADPEQLSLAATMPKFIEQEQQYGSLWRANRSEPSEDSAIDSGARYGLFVAPRDGMGSLIAALAAKLPNGACRTNAPVQRLSPEEHGRWRVHLQDGQTENFDAVLIAAPASQAAKMLHDLDSELGELLGGIKYAGASVVCLGFRGDQLPRPLDSFGFVVPAIENRPIIAGSFSSAKFPCRAPEGRVLVRVFLGGALQPQMNDLADQALIETATEELRDLIGLRGPVEFAEVARWNASMPQYHVGHLARVDQIDSRVARIPGLAVAGSAYRGVGVPQCVQSGESAAERVVGFLTERPF